MIRFICKIFNDIILLYQRKMLEAERNKASFNQKLLTKLIYVNQDNYKDFKKIQETVDNDQVLRFDPEYIQTHRKVNMLAHAKKLIRYHEKFQFSYQMKGRQSIFFSEQMPLSLHFYMFLITLNNLCTDRQIQQFFKPALKCQIIGCYAQTQLSHGSDIQNLTTSAKYDQESESFIINTPEIGGTKWWIGDLGVYANHAIIFAQLIIKNKKYGLHAFLVPIRDKNHNAYPGIQIGDIGPKYGYNNKDNGYLRFNNYKIHRRYMLMKYSKVSKSGVYQRRGNQKISYATMLMIRSSIPYACFYSLSKGCTIAVRYSLYRTQFKDDKGVQIPVLDYQLQQQKIIPRVAQLYATMFGAYSINDMARQIFNAAKEKNDFHRLNQAHSLASGLKAIFTNDALAGLQILRRSLGGHGFSAYSGLPGLISQLGPTCTYEGQNTILYLQTARFLLKGLKYIAKGKQLPPTVQYLREVYSAEFIADFSDVKQVLNPQNIRKIYLYHSCYAVKRLAAKMTEQISNGEDPKKVWDEKVGLDLVESGMAHTYFWIFDNFLTKIFTLITNQALKTVMMKVAVLYGIQKILVRVGQFYSTDVITPQTVKQLGKAKQLLLQQLRPQLLALVQAFEYSDNTLHSAIGGSHQKPYQTLLDWAKNKNEVNKPEVRKQIMTLFNEAKSKFKPKL